MVKSVSCLHDSGSRSSKVDPQSLPVSKDAFYIRANTGAVAALDAELLAAFCIRGRADLDPPSDDAVTEAGPAGQPLEGTTMTTTVSVAKEHDGINSEGQANVPES